MDLTFWPQDRRSRVNWPVGLNWAMLYRDSYGLLVSYSGSWVYQRNPVGHAGSAVYGQPSQSLWDPHGASTLYLTFPPPWTGRLFLKPGSRVQLFIPNACHHPSLCLMPLPCVSDSSLFQPSAGLGSMCWIREKTDSLFRAQREVIRFCSPAPRAAAAPVSSLCPLGIYPLSPTRSPWVLPPWSFLLFADCSICCNVSMRCSFRGNSSKRLLVLFISTFKRSTCILHLWVSSFCSFVSCILGYWLLLPSSPSRTSFWSNPRAWHAIIANYLCQVTKVVDCLFKGHIQWCSCPCAWKRLIHDLRKRIRNVYTRHCVHSIHYTYSSQRRSEVSADPWAVYRCCSQIGHSLVTQVLSSCAGRFLSLLSSALKLRWWITHCLGCFCPTRGL